ncbi:MAG: hypothetical protein SGJ03_17085 [Alphaproteobacteria bacterium]|nr:hypothetical protein [Alphaproteobacteria bacterium]
MNDSILVRLLGASAIIGGAARIASAFGTWGLGALKLEVFYFGIDVALLFGLMGIYFAASERLGFFGFFTFVIAATGIASIVGPDTKVFGIDTYQVGVAAISLGLCLLGLWMLIQRAGSSLAGMCWVASTIVGVGGMYAGESEFGFFAGGILFGLGFVAGGVALFSNATPE